MTEPRKARFLHVGLNYVGTSQRIKELIPHISAARDWYRYAPHCWILYTTRTPKEWSEILRPLLKDGETMLIVEIKIETKQGWLPKGAWDWMNKKR